MPEDLPREFYLAVTVFLGLVLGSFATALSYRLPRGLSIVKMKRSACPSCKRPLSAPDLVPVFSWLFLRGKCRTCKAAIGWQYPAIELATLLLCLLFYARFGFSLPVLAFFALAPVVVSIAAIDFTDKIIPDGLNISVAALALVALGANAALAANPPDFVLEKGVEALAGAAIYCAAALLLRYGVMLALEKDPLGMGDVKFVAAAGMWLGLNPDSAAWLMFVAGAAGIMIALVWKKMRGEAEYPFGPALLAGFIAMLLWQGPHFIVT